MPSDLCSLHLTYLCQSVMLLYHGDLSNMKLGNEFNKVLHIRISEEQYKIIEEQARKEKLSVSAYVRKVLS